MGWLYTFGFDPNSIWAYSPEAGMIWTSEDVYPWIYINDLQQWNYVQKIQDGHEHKYYAGFSEPTSDLSKIVVNFND